MEILTKIREKLSGFFSTDDIRKYYTFGDVLGKGNFGVVRVATNKRTGKRFAVKIIDRTRHDIDGEMLISEMEIQQKINHPFIVKLEQVFWTRCHLYLVQELVLGGDLYERLQHYPAGVSEAEARSVLLQIMSGLQYLHAVGILHRDLKPNNIMCDPQSGEQGGYKIKIADFGLSTFVTSPTPAISDFCGTPLYMAPEIYQHKPYGAKVDIWSAGVICYALLSGYFPFFSENSLEELSALITGGVYTMDVFPSHVTTQARSFVQYLLQVDPAKRPTAAEALEHAWFTEELPSDSLSTPVGACLTSVLSKWQQDLSLSTSPKLRSLFTDDWMFPFYENHVAKFEWNDKLDWEQAKQYFILRDYPAGAFIKDFQRETPCVYRIHSGFVRCLFKSNDGEVFEWKRYGDSSQEQKNMFINIANFFLPSTHPFQNQVLLSAATDVSIYELSLEHLDVFVQDNPLLLVKLYSALCEQLASIVLSVRSMITVRKVSTSAQSDIMSGECTWKISATHSGTFHVTKTGLQLSSPFIRLFGKKHILFNDMESISIKLSECALTIKTKNQTLCTIMLTSEHTLRQLHDLLENQVLQRHEASDTCIDHSVDNMRETRFERLRSIIWSNGNDFAEMLQLGRISKYNKGEYIVKEGQRCFGLFKIHNGSCVLQARDPTDDTIKQVGFVAQHEMFGELSFFGSSVASVSLLANEDNTQVYFFDGDKILAKSRTQPVIGVKIFHHVGLLFSLRVANFIAKTHGLSQI